MTDFDILPVKPISRVVRITVQGLGAQHVISCMEERDSLHRYTPVHHQSEHIYMTCGNSVKLQDKDFTESDGDQILHRRCTCARATILVAK